MDKIVGTQLRVGKDTVNTADAIGGAKFVGIYFGAHWAPPCRLFTRNLAEFYNKVNENGKQFEVVFCSVDGNTDAFERNFALMPWLAVPYSEENMIQSLKQRYGINGIPTLVILDNDGFLIGYDGRQDIANHQAETLNYWEKAKQSRTA